jgi:hypothetical protein
VHRFSAGDGTLHELRITPLLERTLAEAIALHESGELGRDHHSETPAGYEGIWWSAVGGRRWAFVAGWSPVRRLTWDERACAPERMLPVLASMAAAAEDPRAGVLVPRPLAPTQTSAIPRDSPSLVERRLAPPEHPRRYRLPRDASALVEDLLAAAIAEDLDGFTRLLAADARLGLPDRRELGSRSIARIGPELALRQLLAAAARLPATTVLHCPSVDRRVAPAVARGEATLWCMWISDDGLDLLAFGLRGQVEDERADARVTYLGLFPDRPLAPLIIPGEPPPPPVVPIPELVCGDPHAREVSELVCPSEPSPEDENDDH